MSQTRVQGHHQHVETSNFGLCQGADFAGEKKTHLNNTDQGEYLLRVTKKSITETKRDGKGGGGREDDADREEER